MPWYGNRATAIIVDSFEDGGITEYSGDTGSYTVNSTFATDGSNGLEVTGITTTQRIHSTAGLDNYPARGSEFRCDIETNLGTGSVTDNFNDSIIFGFVDTNNFYFARVAVDVPNVQLWEVDAGGFSQLSTGSLSEWNADTTYTFRVQWDDGSTFGGVSGDIDVTMLDSTGSSIGSTSANSTANNGTGVGFRNQHGTSTHAAWFDFYRITT